MTFEQELAAVKGLLATNIEDGERAAIELGRKVATGMGRANWALGDLAAALAPDSIVMGAEDATFRGQDRERLQRFSVAVEVDHAHVLTCRRTSLTFPPVRRRADVSWAVYSMLSGVGTIQTHSPAVWIDRFVKEHGRTPKSRDVGVARNWTDPALLAARRANEDIKAQILAELTQMQAESAAHEAAPDAGAVTPQPATPNPELDSARQSAITRLSPEVQEVENALEKIVPVLNRANDNIALIASSTGSDRIARLAKQTGELSARLHDLLTIEASMAATS